MDVLVQDLRFAWRTLAKAPGFAAVAILTIGIGTGLNATVFSFVDALMMRPAIGVAEPAKLVAVYTSDYSSGPFEATSYPDFLSMRDEPGLFASLAAFQSGSFVVMESAGAAERVRAAHASGDLFAVLGVPAMGRAIERPDASPGAPPVVVLGEALWQRAFGGRRDAIGQTVTVDGQVRTIVGVLPARFTGLDLVAAIDLWVPLVESAEARGGRGDRGLHVVGRLAPGVTVDAADARIRALAARLAATYPESNLGTLDRPTEPRAMTVRRHSRIGPAFAGQVSELSGVLAAATSLVLFVACANVAGLLLARATTRSREIAVRLALGASRARLVRQLLTESLVLGLAASGAGLLLALWTVGALPAFLPPEQAMLLSATIDGRVLAVSVVMGLACAVIVGLAPAFQTRHIRAAIALRSDAGAISDPRGASRLRHILVAAQIALSCVLVVATSLLTRSVANQMQADLGFETRRAVVVSMAPPDAFTPAEALETWRRATEQLQALPGVESVGLAATLPLTRASRRGFRPDGYAFQTGEETEFPINVVDTRYFETMGLPVLAGRGFGTVDTVGSRPVVVVNDVFARRFYAGRAVGRLLTDSRRVQHEIVGVVGSGPYLSVHEPPAPTVYYPLAHHPQTTMTAVVRTAVDPASLADAVRRTAIAVSPRVAVFRLRTLSDHLAEASASDRLTAALVGTCSVIAVVLAVVGMYGVLAYAVARRGREIGVRIALGARPVQIARLVVASGLRLALVGTAIGLVASFATVNALRSFLYAVSPRDPMAFALAPVALGLIVALASLVPVRRAVRTDPVRVLRAD